MYYSQNFNFNKHAWLLVDLKQEMKAIAEIHWLMERDIETNMGTLT